MIDTLRSQLAHFVLWLIGQTVCRLRGHHIEYDYLIAGMAWCDRCGESWRIDGY